MGKIVWLASYPKSGNTWMRVLLTNYLRDGDTPADINNLQGGPIAAARVWFDEWAGIEASQFDDTLIERLRPDVYRLVAEESPDTLYLKVHDAWRLTDRLEPLFPPDITAGVVYIARNPLDLAGSCAHHWGVTVDRAVECMCHPEFAIARSHGGLADQLRQVLKSWSGHVQSWVDESGLPVHLVRYEDMLQDPTAVFGDVVHSLELHLDSERLRKAVAFSDFAELKRQEEEKGFRERSPKASGPFFRRGEAGLWREELPGPLATCLIETHGEMMGRLGYLDGKNEPF